MISIGAGALDLDGIVRIARGGEPVELPDAVAERVDRAHRDLAAVAARRPVYGRTTGVGANRLVTVEEDDAGHGLRLLRSHASDAGPALPGPVVRAMLVVRLQQLAAGGSGVRAEVLRGLVRMLNDDALPSVRRFGGIGTADLPALAGTALTLLGERPASAPLVPLTEWDAADSLPFISSSALTIGRAALAVHDLRALLAASLGVTALSWHAVRANREALSEAAARAALGPGCARVADLLGDLVGSGPEAARIQDPYGYRAVPQVVGPAWAAVADLVGLVERGAGLAQENPLVFRDEAGRPDVVHHGGFHEAGLGLSIDYVKLALAQSLPLNLARLRVLIEPSYTGLAPFLAAGPSSSSGVMMVEYVAAQAYGSLRSAAQPASLQTAVLSRGAEDDASFATVGVEQLEDCVEAYRVVLACELVTTVRCLRQQGFAMVDAGSEALREIFDRCCARLPDGWDDRSLRGDLALAQELLPELGQRVLHREGELSDGGTL